MRNKFSYLFYGILKKQCIMKGLITEEDWESWKNDIYVDFVRDNHFTELKNSELIRERLTILDQVQQYVGEFFSKDWVMKNVLNMSEDDIEDMKKQISDEKSSGEIPSDEEPQQGEQ